MKIYEDEIIDTESSENSIDEVEESACNEGTIEAGDDLLTFFDDLLENSESPYYIDDNFESQGLQKNKDVDRQIKEANLRYQSEDADLKLKSRKGLTNFLLSILLIQMIFMNLVIGWLIFSQTTNLQFLRDMEIQQLGELTTLAKWYAAATAAELIGAFISIIVTLYKKPKIT